MKETVLETLEKSGLDNALSRFDELADKRQRVQLKVAFAKEVEQLMPDESRASLAVADRYANGLATDVELRNAAYAAAAARAAADAADAATASRATARTAAVTARVAAAANAAYTNVSYADDAWVAASSEMEAKQVEILKQFLEDTP